jgi:hypothetical protein
MAETVFVIKDDYDQSTVCVVRAKSEAQAIETATRTYGGSENGGDFYAFSTELLDGRLVVVPEDK